MKRHKVYLAGPITGLTYDGGQNWRAEAMKMLDEYGIDGYSPLRGKDYLRRHGELPPHGVSGKNPLGTNKGIVARDINDVRTSDALLINFLGATKVSIGTVAEIGAAYALHKPMVLVMEKEDNPHNHGFIVEMCGFHVETVQDGVDILGHLLLP